MKQIQSLRAKFWVCEFGHFFVLPVPFETRESKMIAVRCECSGKKVTAARNNCAQLNGSSIKLLQKAKISPPSSANKNINVVKQNRGTPKKKTGQNGLQNSMFQLGSVSLFRRIAGSTRPIWPVENSDFLNRKEGS